MSWAVAMGVTRIGVPPCRRRCHARRDRRPWRRRSRRAPPEHSRRREEAEAEQGAGQVEEPLEQVRPALVADAKTATAEQPRERALHHPAMAAEPLGGVNPAPS